MTRCSRPLFKAGATHSDDQASAAASADRELVMLALLRHRDRQRAKFQYDVRVHAVEDFPIMHEAVFIELKRKKKRFCTQVRLCEGNRVEFNENLSFSCTHFIHRKTRAFSEKTFKLHLRSAQATSSGVKLNYECDVPLHEFASVGTDTWRKSFVLEPKHGKKKDRGAVRPQCDVTIRAEWVKDLSGDGDDGSHSERSGSTYSSHLSGHDSLSAGDQDPNSMTETESLAYPSRHEAGPDPTASSFVDFDVDDTKHHNHPLSGGAGGGGSNGGGGVGAHGAVGVDEFVHDSSGPNAQGVGPSSLRERSMTAIFTDVMVGEAKESDSGFMGRDANLSFELQQTPIAKHRKSFGSMESLHDGLAPVPERRPKRLTVRDVLDTLPSEEPPRDRVSTPVKSPLADVQRRKSFSFTAERRGSSSAAVEPISFADFDADGGGLDSHDTNDDAMNDTPTPDAASAITPTNNNNNNNENNNKKATMDDSSLLAKALRRRSSQDRGRRSRRTAVRLSPRRQALAGSPPASGREEREVEASGSDARSGGDKRNDDDDATRTDCDQRRDHVDEQAVEEKSSKTIEDEEEAQMCAATPVKGEPRSLSLAQQPQDNQLEVRVSEPEPPPMPSEAALELLTDVTLKEPCCGQHKDDSKKKEERFWNGIPVSACVLARCLTHWHAFDLERQWILEQIVSSLGEVARGTYGNNDDLAFLLANVSVLLRFVLQSSKRCAKTPTAKPQLGDAARGRAKDGDGDDDDDKHENYQWFASELRSFAHRVFRNLLRNVLQWFGAVHMDGALDASADLAAASSEGDTIRRLDDAYSAALEVLDRNHVLLSVRSQFMGRLFRYVDAQLVNSVIGQGAFCTPDAGIRLQMLCSSLEQWAFDHGGEDMRLECRRNLSRAHETSTLLLVDRVDDEVRALCPDLNLSQIEHICRMFNERNPAQARPKAFMLALRAEIDEQDVPERVFCDPYEDAVEEFEFQTASFLLSMVPVSARLVSDDEFAFLLGEDDVTAL